jgi:hypothetical protein
VNWFPKKSTIALAFSFVWCYSWKAVNSDRFFCPSLFISDFAIGHIAWGVTPQFPAFVSHCSNAFLRVIHLRLLATHLNAVLGTESRVSCHSSLNLRLCFSTPSTEGILLFRYETAIWVVDSLYAKIIKVIMSRNHTSASSPKLIWILGEINLETRLWNRSNLWFFNQVWKVSISKAIQ